MNKYTLLIIVLAFYNSTALGQVYELEWQGQSGQYHSPSELYEFGFLDFNNNEQPDLILVTYHNDDSRTVTVLDENYSEILARCSAIQVTELSLDVTIFCLAINLELFKLIVPGAPYCKFLLYASN